MGGPVAGYVSTLNMTSDNIALGECWPQFRIRHRQCFGCASEILDWTDVHDPQTECKSYKAFPRGLLVRHDLVWLTCTTCWSLWKILNRLLIWFNYQWKFTSAQSSQQSKLLTDNEMTFIKHIGNSNGPNSQSMVCF